MRVTQVALWQSVTCRVGGEREGTEKYRTVTRSGTFGHQKSLLAQQPIRGQNGTAQRTILVPIVQAW